ncbi:MAG TPA: hypothetical protein DDW36_01130 [Candidatus Magasanikbacteria bacterium]|nr:hypothetical protein [Candidatus Magasanikbacteria bacterium]
MRPKFLKLKIQAEHCISGNVLDVGFAANPNSFLKDAIGLDICLPLKKPDVYKEMIQFNLNTTDELPFADKSFKNVVVGDTIEHLENPSHFLRRANRILTDGGRLIISTPQANDWWVTLHNWFFRSLVNDPDPGEHLQNWTILDMIRLLKKNGFSVKKIEGFFMYFPKIKFMIRVKKYPILSWQVFYIAEKVGPPNSEVLTRVDDKIISVKQ